MLVWTFLLLGACGGYGNKKIDDQILQGNEVPPNSPIEESSVTRITQVENTTKLKIYVAAGCYDSQKLELKIDNACREIIPPQCDATVVMSNLKDKNAEISNCNDNKEAIFEVSPDHPYDHYYLYYGKLEPIEIKITKADDDIEKMAALSKEIESMAKDKSCDAATACAAIGIGSRPCGGPESIVVYSTTQMDVVEFKKKVKEHAELQKRYNEKNGTMSICSVLEIPETQCVQSICQESPK